MLACACAVLTVKQIGSWKDTGALYQRAMAVTKNNILATVGLGSVLAERGDLDSAIAMDERAVQIAPGYYEAHYNLGVALTDKGRLDDAIVEFQNRHEMPAQRVRQQSRFGSRPWPAKAISTVPRRNLKKRSRWIRPTFPPTPTWEKSSWEKMTWWPPSGSFNRL